MYIFLRTEIETNFFFKTICDDKGMTCRILGNMRTMSRRLIMVALKYIYIKKFLGIREIDFDISNY